LTDFGRRGRIAGFEIGVHRQIAGGHDRSDMRQHAIAADGVVRQSQRPGRTRARGGDRFEAEMLEIARAADIPRIGNDEAAALMERTKHAALLGDAGHDAFLSPRSLYSPSGEVGETRKRRAGWGSRTYPTPASRIRSTPTLHSGEGKAHAAPETPNDCPAGCP